MNKLLTGLFASLLSVGAFAQTSVSTVPAAPAVAPIAAPAAPAKVVKKEKAKVRKATKETHRQEAESETLSGKPQISRLARNSGEASIFGFKPQYVYE